MDEMLSFFSVQKDKSILSFEFVFALGRRVNRFFLGRRISGVGRRMDVGPQRALLKSSAQEVVSEEQALGQGPGESWGAYHKARL